MIAGAALLVLLGLGLFVAGLVTGVAALYWGCVGACLVAGVLLLLVRRQLDRPPAPAGPAAGDDASAVPPVGSDAATATAQPAAPAVVESPAPADLPDPPVEEAEVTDLLLVVDLEDEVLVVDEHPRYHVAGCVHLAGRTTIPLPLDEARSDGFTPCAVCTPDRTLAQRVRERRAAGSA